MADPAPRGLHYRLRPRQGKPRELPRSGDVMQSQARAGTPTGGEDTGSEDVGSEDAGDEGPGGETNGGQPTSGEAATPPNAQVSTRIDTGHFNATLYGVELMNAYKCTSKGLSIEQIHFK
ncbi:hypothetical protein K469DRAFT_744354 [Zopfia rhizophila CBS 207.26]|uniref:Uncharacterized protein n=1 Tax=Zopfia rhizophila CBS 207.26 TaxID=1314779 RepID=A0A6A6ES57_9PEZI|nr:hypothetical protein K469DRAFT_744354 [Zopfia rhizophila CBS 207.26]